MRAGEIFCIPSSFCFCLLAPLVYPLYALAAFRHPFLPFLSFYIYHFFCAFTYKKKKNKLYNQRQTHVHMKAYSVTFHDLGAYDAGFFLS